MTLIALDAAAKRLNPFLVLVALGLLLVDGLVGVSRHPPGAAPQRPAPVVPPASAVLSSDVAAALADMKDRD
jgi:hypothetical protein